MKYSHLPTLKGDSKGDTVINNSKCTQIKNITHFPMARYTEMIVQLNLVPGTIIILFHYCKYDC